MKYFAVFASLVFLLALGGETIEGGIIFDVLKHTAETASKVSADVFDGIMEYPGVVFNRKGDDADDDLLTDVPQIALNSKMPDDKPTATDVKPESL